LYGGRPGRAVRCSTRWRRFGGLRAGRLGLAFRRGVGGVTVVGPELTAGGCGEEGHTEGPERRPAGGRRWRVFITHWFVIEMGGTRHLAVSFRDRSSVSATEIRLAPRPLRSVRGRTARFRGCRVRSTTRRPGHSRCPR